MKGVIARINEKGFGFITPDGEKEDVFFHLSDCPNGDFKQMQQGNAVTFDLGTSPSPKGPKATNVIAA